MILHDFLYWHLLKYNQLTYYRHQFPKSAILPMMHFLEDHVIPWIQQWSFGLGFHGEEERRREHTCSVYHNEESTNSYYSYISGEGMIHIILRNSLVSSLVFHSQMWQIFTDWLHLQTYLMHKQRSAKSLRESQIKPWLFSNQPSQSGLFENLCAGSTEIGRERRGVEYRSNNDK